MKNVGICLFSLLTCFLFSSSLSLAKYNAKSEVLVGDGDYRPHSYKDTKIFGPEFEDGISIHRAYIPNNLPIERFYQLVAMSLEQEKMYPEELKTANGMAYDRNEEGIFL